MKSYILLLTALAASTTFAGERGKNPVSADKNTVLPEPAPRTPPQWRVSAGPVYRSLGSASWRSGPSLSSRFMIDSLVGSSRRPSPGAAGPADSYADRLYQDGFVRIGSPTHASGDTWNWGYDDASQVQGDSVAFHGGAGSSATYRSDRSRDRPFDWDDDVEGFGPAVSLDLMFNLSPSLVLGPQLSFFFLPWDASRSGSTFSGSQELRSFRNSLTDQFGLDGSIAPVAPYSGSFNGPGILLRNQPDSRHFSPERSGVERAVFSNQILENLDIDLYTFSLGMQAGYQRGPFTARVGAGLGLDVADVNAERTESLIAETSSGRQTLQKWRHENNHTEVVPGFYLSMETGVSFTKNLGCSVFGRYDWRDEIEGSLGPSHYTVDLSGWTVGGAVTWRW